MEHRVFNLFFLLYALCPMPYARLSILRLRRDLDLVAEQKRVGITSFPCLLS